MYYYIFDIRKCKKRSQITDIKGHLAALGISGEFTFPSAAYTAEELVELGISKKYNTIVGIGNDEIANVIAAKLCGRTEAMGFIPLEASADLCNLVGATHWREAADNLRYRIIKETKIGRLANGKAFLTNVELGLKAPAEVTIEFKDYLVQAKISHLQISNYNPAVKKIGPDFLNVVFQSVDAQDSSIFNKLSSFLGLIKKGEQSLSLIRARSLRLFTSSQIPLVCHEEQIGKTPQFIESSDEDLRLIIGRKGE